MFDRGSRVILPTHPNERQINQKSSRVGRRKAQGSVGSTTSGHAASVGEAQLGFSPPRSPFHLRGPSSPLPAPRSSALPTVVEA